MLMSSRIAAFLLATVAALTAHAGQREDDLAGALFGILGRTIGNPETKKNLVGNIEKEIDELHNHSYYSKRHPCFESGGNQYRHNDMVLGQDECLSIADQKFQAMRAASQVREQAENDKRSSEIALFVAMVRKGDRSGANKCYHRSGFTEEAQAQCVKATTEALNAAIAAGVIKPVDCFEWALKNPGHGTSDADTIMRVRLASNDSPGWFRGTVQDIEGSNLGIYFKPMQANALLTTHKGSAIIEGKSIAIGTQVFGFGVQIGTKKVTLISGERTTIPVIAVRCISPVGLVEQLLSR